MPTDGESADFGSEIQDEEEWVPEDHDPLGLCIICGDPVYPIDHHEHENRSRDAVPMHKGVWLVMSEKQTAQSADDTDRCDHPDCDESLESHSEEADGNWCSLGCLADAKGFDLGDKSAVGRGR